MNRSSASQVDTALVAFLNDAEASGEQFYLAKHAVLGCQHTWRGLKGKLVRAWDCVSGWQSRRAWSNRVPMSRDILEYLFLTAVNWALADQACARLLFPFAILLRLGFYGLLRPGEICRMKVGDISVPPVSSGDSSVVVAIADPKTKRFMGRAQFSQAQDGCTVRWLRWLLEGLPPGVKVWPSTLQSFRTMFRAVLEKARLTLPLTPGSLRAGGATHLVTSGMEIARIRFLGRWKSDTGLAAYIQEAVARLVWHQLSCGDQDRIRAGLAAWSASLFRAPNLPWTSFFSRRRQWRSMTARSTSRRRKPLTGWSRSGGFWHRNRLATGLSATSWVMSADF